MPETPTEPKTGHSKSSANQSGKRTEADVKNTPEDQKNVDRDGGERQPNQHTDHK